MINKRNSVDISIYNPEISLAGVQGFLPNQWKTLHFSHSRFAGKAEYPGREWPGTHQSVCSARRTEGHFNAARWRFLYFFYEIFSRQVRFSFYGLVEQTLINACSGSEILLIFQHFFDEFRLLKCRAFRLKWKNPLHFSQTWWRIWALHWITGMPEHAFECLLRTAELTKYQRRAPKMIRNKSNHLRSISPVFENQGLIEQTLHITRTFRLL